MEIGRSETKMNDRFGLVGHIPLFQGVNYVLKTYYSLYSLQNKRRLGSLSKADFSRTINSTLVSTRKQFSRNLGTRSHSKSL